MAVPVKISYLLLWQYVACKACSSKHWRFRASQVSSIASPVLLPLSPCYTHEDCSTMARYVCELCLAKECSWAEHLTSQPKRKGGRSFVFTLNHKRASMSYIFTATLCPRGLTNEPPAPLNLSPDSTQHSEQQHVTCVIMV